MRDCTNIRSNRASQRAGLTLIELLVVMTITAILGIAISMAFSSEVTMQRAQETRRAKSRSTETMERTITRMISGARLAATATGTATAGATATTATATTATATSTAASSATTYLQGLSEGGSTVAGSDRITFTTTAPSIPMAAMSSTDDFQTQQTARGPVGGLSEVSLSITAIGDAGGKTGLFERIQTPSDADPTQGGLESVLDPDVASIGFQFWDGTEWLDTWDTTTMTPARLPEAVQVTYTLTGETGNTQHVFVVPILASDVTPQNPVTSGGTVGTTTGTAGTAG